MRDINERKTYDLAVKIETLYMKPALENNILFLADSKIGRIHFTSVFTITFVILRKPGTAVAILDI